MRTLFFSIAVIAAGSAVALAADVSGDIKSVDTTKNTITLEDGSVYNAPQTLDISKFKAGEKVNMSFDKSGDKMMITSVKPAGRP